MAEGRIGTVSILQRAANFLGIEGVRRFPSHVNTSEVQPVINIANFSPYAVLSKSTGVISLDGASGISMDLLGPSTQAVPGSYDTSNIKEFRVLAMQLDLSYDAAGAIADATVFNEVDLYLTPANTVANQQVFITRIPLAIVVTVGKLTYGWDLEAYGNTNNTVAQFGWIPSKPWVPAGSTFGLFFGRPAGGVYPANTRLEVKTVYVECPKGCIPPQ